MDQKSQKISVDHLARLANLRITPEEKAKIGSQLEETVNYFDILEKAKEINQEKPTFQVTNNVNVIAEDKTGPCLPRQKILSQKKYFTAKK